MVEIDNGITPTGDAPMPGNVADSGRLRPRNTETTRRQILDAAEALFVRHGFARTAVSQIAKAAGVTKSLIHHHFGSKEALWEAVKLRRFNLYTQAQRRLIEMAEASDDLLRLSVEEYFKFLQQNPQFLRLQTWMQLENDVADREPARELIDLSIRKLRDAQAAGKLRLDISPHHLLAMVLGAIRHWFYVKREIFPASPPPPNSSSTSDTHSGDGRGRSDDAFLMDLTRILFDGAIGRIETSDSEPSGAKTGTGFGRSGD